MKFIFAACALSMLVACGAQDMSEGAASADANVSASAGANGEWATLFDGTGLSAFQINGDANWLIESDAVGADTGNGMLVTTDVFGDFEIELEFWADVPANSGVFIRCADPNDITAANCYEVNIYDTRADQTYRTGGIVDVAAPASQMNAAGRWNRYVISADGSRLHVVLNGEEMVDVEDSKLASGHIGLQYGAGVVKFRNVRIRSL